MSCDLHLYAEVKNEDSNLWQFLDVCGGTCPYQNYDLFGLMSEGVRRTYDEDWEENYGVKALEITEIPDDVSSLVFYDYFNRIVSNRDYEDNKYYNTISYNRFMEYINETPYYLIDVLKKDEHRNITHLKRDQAKLITEEDVMGNDSYYIIDNRWHSPNVITIKEMEYVLDMYATVLRTDYNYNVKEINNALVYWDAFLNYVKTYENADMTVRIIYWFDN